MLSAAGRLKLRLPAMVWSLRCLVPLWCSKLTTPGFAGPAML
jgi:hypothetical protein